MGGGCIVFVCTCVPTCLWQYNLLVQLIKGVGGRLHVRPWQLALLVGGGGGCGRGRGGGSMPGIPEGRGCILIVCPWVPTCSWQYDALVQLSTCCQLNERHTPPYEVGTQFACVEGVV